MHKIQNSLNSISALHAHDILDAESSIDPGEMEAIPVRIELSGTFVSCDVEAVEKYREIEEKNGSVGFLFLDYCKELQAQGIITPMELQAITLAVNT